MARVDQNGVFRLNALPPGERYLALAVDYLEQGEFQDPLFLERMKGRATAFSLNEGENKNSRPDAGGALEGIRGQDQDSGLGKA